MKNLDTNNSNHILDLRLKRRSTQNINKLIEEKKQKKDEEEAKEILSWRTLDSTKDNEQTTWLKLAVLGSFVIFIGALWTKNFIAAITFFLLSLAIFMNSRINPKEIEVIITSKGIIVDEHNYFFNDLESFWISDDENPTLILRSKKFFMPYTEIYLADQDSNKIREILKNYLKEEKEKKYPLKDISRIIKI